jgi:hypothetical protein
VIVVDSVERLDASLGVMPVAIGDLILVEVLQGFRSEKDVPRRVSCSVRSR